MSSNKRERTPTDDDDEIDVFSGDSFHGVDAKDIIVLEAKKFHLPQLYHWVRNLDHTTNPLTNLDFTQDSLDTLDIEARERYPLAVSIKDIFGKTETKHSTGLMSHKKLAFLLHAADTTNHTLEKMLSERIEYRLNGGETLPSILLNRGNDQLMMGDTLSVYKVHLSGSPLASIQRYNILLAFALRWNLPVDRIEAKIKEAQAWLEESQRLEKLRERIQASRAVREAELDIHQAPGTQKVGVMILTNYGSAYGMFHVFIDPSEPLETLEILAAHHVDGIIKFPQDKDTEFIFAGAKYGASTKICDIPRLGADSVVHLAFSEY